MAHQVLIVHESESIRGEIHRELLAEGMKVVEADSASAAVREIWQGTFDVVVLGGRLVMNGTSLEDHLRTIAPEVVTVPIGKESAAKIAKRVVDILEGAAAA